MEFARFMISFCAAVLWIGLLAPAILRTVGIPMAGGLWRLDRLNRHLNRPQYAWGYGVFAFGLGIFFCTALRDYLEWGQASDGVTHFTLGNIALRLIIWLAVGLFIGSYTASSQKNSVTPVRNGP